jgi:NAD(P)-dependent dehydrogenase (short-subunit alcohol dehydrogenase family)
MKSPVLVLDAAGSFGASLVQAQLEAGRPVVAVGEEVQALRQLTERFAGRGRLVTLVGSAHDDAAAADLALALRELPSPPLNALINLQKSCTRGRLLDQAPGFLEHTLRVELFPHLHAARHLLPLLGASGRCARYLIVGAPYAGTSWLGYGHYSIAAAAIRMLVQVLRQETMDSSVRVQQLTIDAPVRTDENRQCACAGWPDGLAVARHAAAVLDAPDDAAVFIPFDSRHGTHPPSTPEVLS